MPGETWLRASAQVHSLAAGLRRPGRDVASAVAGPVARMPARSPSPGAVLRTLQEAAALRSQQKGLASQLKAAQQENRSLASKVEELQVGAPACQGWQAGLAFWQTGPVFCNPTRAPTVKLLRQPGAAPRLPTGAGLLPAGGRWQPRATRQGQYVSSQPATPGACRALPRGWTWRRRRRRTRRRCWRSARAGRRCWRRPGTRRGSRRR